MTGFVDFQLPHLMTPEGSFVKAFLQMFLAQCPGCSQLKTRSENSKVFHLCDLRAGGVFATVGSTSSMAKMRNQGYTGQFPKIVIIPELLALIHSFVGCQILELPLPACMVHYVNTTRTSEDFP